MVHIINNFNFEKEMFKGFKNVMFSASQYEKLQRVRLFSSERPPHKKPNPSSILINQADPELAKQNLSKILRKLKCDSQRMKK